MPVFLQITLSNKAASNACGNSILMLAEPNITLHSNGLAEINTGFLCFGNSNHFKGETLHKSLLAEYI